MIALFIYLRRFTRCPLCKDPDPTTSLSTVCCLSSVSTVEPPTNITFHCHNMHNILKWSYGEMVPDLRFRVDIYAITGPSRYVPYI